MASTEASRLATEYQQEASEKGLPWARARAARARGMIAVEEEMEAAFDEAMRLHGKTPTVSKRLERSSHTDPDFGESAGG